MDESVSETYALARPYQAKPSCDDMGFQQLCCGSHLCELESWKIKVLMGEWQPFSHDTCSTTITYGCKSNYTNTVDVCRSVCFLKKM